MCYASQPVTRKVFDYNAYIQGRLRGEYVVIYHTVVEEPEDVASDIQLDITDMPTFDIQQTTVIPIISFSNNIHSDLIWATTISRDIFSDYYYTTNLTLPIKATSINCRGAPHLL
ncbi:hypothetical protein Q765_05025 [Flavobacterium rivuli WB 3.3-2 = DSM 21788]|uniref:Uncharacterized protein n=1 Tax=Flavobacterium rivuli WB 3.3-2 = DSM 21788 TaxID=1121895 RepID=A0A0A2MHQ6_9FLAO|nr:hypothetical protein [Flavobacterium rivuli]KGO87850.1 hypothetical protein Q765_05025 [Flavobacterium rivuli WB 3.3-2 = DSM 21788]